MKQRLPKYLARPTDYAIWSINKDGRTYSSMKQKEKFPDSLHQKTPYQTLIDFEFYPVEEKDFFDLEMRGREYYEFLKWQSRSDGHGGIKGGTIEEFRRQKNTK